MRKTAAVIVVSFIASLLSILYSCDKSKEKPLIIVDNIKVDRYANLETVYTSIIGALVFNPLLYRYNSGTAVHFALADEVKVLPGNKAIEVKLKEGIRFHDGTPLTSKEIVRSFYILKKDLKTESLKAVEAELIDQLRFRLTSDSPLTDVESLSETIEAFSPSTANLINGTGPFSFKRWVDNGVELEANKNYFEGAPNLNKIIYLYEPDERKRLAMLLKGEADLLAGISPDAARFLKKDGRFRVHEDHAGFYTALFFNNNSPLFSDKMVRKAVSMTIDRNTIIEKGLNGGGISISSPFPPEILPPRETRSQSYDPKEALKILWDAGWKDMDGDGILEKDGKNLSFTLYYPRDFEELQRIADILGQQLFEAGIGMESAMVSIREIGSISEDYSGIIYTASYDEHFNINRWLSTSPPSEYGNLSRYCNKEVDLLIEQVLEAKGAEDKKTTYGRLRELFDVDVPAAFLYAPISYIAISKEFRGTDMLGFHVYSFYKIKDWETERR